KAAALLDTLDVAILRLKDFSETASRELTASADRARVNLEQTAVQATAAFAQELERTTSAAHTSLHQMQQVLSDPAMVEDREQLRRQMRAAGAAAGTLTRSLENLATQGDSSVHVVRRADESFQG